MQNLIYLVEMNVKRNGLNLRLCLLLVRPLYLNSFILMYEYGTFILLWKNLHRWTFFQRCFRSMIIVYYFLSRIETWHNREKNWVSWHVSIIIPSYYYYNYNYYYYCYYYYSVASTGCMLEIMFSVQFVRGCLFMWLGFYTVKNLMSDPCPQSESWNATD
jgi:hypothetical protein